MKTPRADQTSLILQAKLNLVYFANDLGYVFLTPPQVKSLCRCLDQHSHQHRREILAVRLRWVPRNYIFVTPPIILRQRRDQDLFLGCPVMATTHCVILTSTKNGNCETLFRQNSFVLFPFILVVTIEPQCDIQMLIILVSEIKALPTI